MSKTLFAAFNEGVSHSMSGNHEAAIHAFNKVLKEDPNHTPALSAKGFSLSSLGRPAEALRCFERVITLDPTGADAHRQAGLLQLELGEPETAAALLTRALQLNPEPGYREAAAAELLTLGQSLLSRGPRRADKARLRHARAAFTLALELHPYFADAAHALADVWGQLGDEERRGEYLHLAAKLRPVKG
ncbi:tetratricopeptide repeat protein [Myxococcaceae bacterium GXIMD 01537]